MFCVLALGGFPSSNDRVPSKYSSLDSTGGMGALPKIHSTELSSGSSNPLFCRIERSVHLLGRGVAVGSVVLGVDVAMGLGRTDVGSTSCAVMGTVHGRSSRKQTINAPMYTPDRTITLICPLLPETSDVGQVNLCLDSLFA